jgi:hypothetical protein
MAVHIRDGNLSEDVGVLTGLAQRYLNSDADQNRFRWLYQESPFGPARAWIACDAQGESIGMAALFPRRMYSGSSIVLGCVLGDFCLVPKYRTLGPALQLQRACLAGARSGAFAVAYDFPSSTMLRIYQHLGMSPIGESVRLAKTLRIDRKIAHSLRVPALSRSIATTMNFALALKDRPSSNQDGLDFRLESERCSPEYSNLAEQVGSSLGICTVRSAEYLNWRYWLHPRLKYEFLAARQANELLTYCTFTVSDGNAIVVEIFGSMQAHVVTGLLGELARLLRARGVATVSMPVLSSDPRIGLLRKLGFWARESVPVMAFARESTLSGSEMFLMHGDRES